MKNILIVGAGGQIGSELTAHLRSIYGNSNVVAADIRKTDNISDDGPFEQLDVMECAALASLVHKYKIDTIFNLVALLSATGEKNPTLAWRINMGALTNCLEVARWFGCSIFTPSSIGAFGENTPHDDTPQDTIMRPNTIYGVCKVSGELLSDYYHSRFGVDSRSVRFPGIISNVTLPGGGTTDYAVEIFYEAIRKGSFVCPVPDNVYMDMMYMPDALNACVKLMEADPSRLVHRNSFNIASMSFTPEILYAAIKKRMPEFTMTYDVDPVKKAIAESWPNKMDDSCARKEWDWAPEWNLDLMVDDMLKVIKEKFDKGLIR
ncbi:MAG: NAD-dependent epimerase/dehydratase family protein [Rikenellaceae bacterium]|nr:NAD-dependent epimerase/dehydratase family protein [Rikenellaceae bacterium]MDE7356114.1 NAD-dependent epimerase/dehydratase family protein [Rikenellaceae bacterium]